jgi:hypothetical protein
MQNPNSHFHAKSSFRKIPHHKFPIYSTFGFSRNLSFSCQRFEILRISLNHLMGIFLASEYTISMEYNLILVKLNLFICQIHIACLPSSHPLHKFAKFTLRSWQVHIAKSSSSHLQVANTTLLSRTAWMCFELPTFWSISRLLTTWNFNGWIQIWWMNQLTPFIGLI